MVIIKNLWLAAVVVVTFFLLFLAHESNSKLVVLFQDTNSTSNVVAKPTTTKPSAISEQNDYGLGNLCKQTNWTEGLWLHCHSYDGDNHTSIRGGLNNARNRIQTCLRLAIDAGAGIIIPSATTRDETDLVKTDSSKKVCPDYFWDMEHLQKTMGSQCPQMKIRICDDRSGLSNIVETPQRTYLNPAHTDGSFKDLVQISFQASNFTLANVTAQNPVIVNYGDSYIGWNYRQAKELTTIRKALFKALKFKKELLDLSAHILKSPMLHKGNFIGVHLRGESDWPAGFGSLEDQTRMYIEQIKAIQLTVKYGVKTIYVSCGDPNAIEGFRKKLQPMGYTVVDKSIILKKNPILLHQLESLSFDQKAIVEYQALVEARFWMGLVMSSMSALIAYARTVDEEQDFFNDHVFHGSHKAGLNRNYQVVPAMKGNDFTKLMVVNGVDIMDSFP